MKEKESNPESTDKDLSPNPHHFQEHPPQESSGLKRLSNVVMEWLGIQPKQSREKQIDRRMRELKNIAEEVLFQLKEVEEDIKNQDSELSPFVEQLVDPMIRDVNRIHRMSERKVTTTDQLRLMEKYNEWITQAKPWVHFFVSQQYDKESLIKAVVRHAISVSDGLIDKDVQVIQDYQDHKFEELGLVEAEKIKVRKRISSALEAPIQKLISLRKDPEELSLEQLDTWKKEVNFLREKFYNEALHTVDGIIQDVDHNPAPEVVREQQILNFEELADLEDSVPKLLQAIEDESLDPDRKRKLRNELISLEHEVHELEQELLLTPELYQRLQLVKQSLQKAHKRLIPLRIKKL